MGPGFVAMVDGGCGWPEDGAVGLNSLSFGAEVKMAQCCKVELRKGPQRGEGACADAQNKD